MRRRILIYHDMSSTRFKALEQEVDRKKVYPIAEAMELVKKTAKAKFDEAVELHLHLGIDPSKSDQQVRGTTVLPHGTGKTKRVIAFVEADKEAEAKQAGADLVGGEALIEELVKDPKITFDVAVATPGMMPKLAKLAKILGPKGLMPNPKTDTISANIGKIVQEQKAGKVSFKNDDTGNIHQIFGRASFDTAKLQENYIALVETVRKMKPSSAKGEFIGRATIASSMGPGIRIELP